MSASANKRLVILAYVALTLSTLLVYWQVRSFDFVNYDDNTYVYENPGVTGGLTLKGFIGAFTTPYVGNWLPLTWLSFMADGCIFGLDPGWMHLVNVFLHLANTLLLFTLLRKMTGAMWQSAFVAAAFALHPMHVESVAWITERKDVLSTLLLLLTVTAYISYVSRRGKARYLLTALLFTAGLLAKPMLVTLPLLLLLLDYWPLRRLDSPRDLRRLMIEKVPLLLLSVASSSVTFYVQRAGGSLSENVLLSPQSRVANAMLSYAKYIGRLFLPQDLAVFYPLDARSIQYWQAALCAFLMLAVSVLVIRFGRKQRYLVAGWFWFVVALVPVIGLVQSGAQAMADRYTYIPYIGLFIMIAWGLPELLSKWPQRNIALAAAAALALAPMGVATWRQAGYWRNSLTLFTHAIEAAPDNYVAHSNRGSTYVGLGRWQEAIDDYKEALRIRPDLAEAYYNLGVAYDSACRWQDAVDALKRAVGISPDYAEAYSNLGVAYGGLGRWREAVDAYKQALTIKPDSAETCNDLGVAYGGLGRWREAADAYRQALTIDPRYAKARGNLAVACCRLADADASAGRFGEAVDMANEALALVDAASQPQLKVLIQGRLACYKQGKPWIEPAARP